MFEERRLKKKFFVLGSVLYLGNAILGDIIERAEIRRGNDSEIIATLDGFKEVKEYFLEEGIENRRD